MKKIYIKVLIVNIILSIFFIFISYGNSNYYYIKNNEKEELKIKEEYIIKYKLNNENISIEDIGDDCRIVLNTNLINNEFSDTNKELHYNIKKDKDLIYNAKDLYIIGSSNKINKLTTYWHRELYENKNIGIGYIKDNENYLVDRKFGTESDKNIQNEILYTNNKIINSIQGTEEQIKNCEIIGSDNNLSLSFTIKKDYINIIRYLYIGNIVNINGIENTLNYINCISEPLDISKDNNENNEEIIVNNLYGGNINKKILKNENNDLTLINIDDAISWAKDPTKTIPHTCLFVKTWGKRIDYNKYASIKYISGDDNTEGHYEYCTICNKTKNFEEHSLVEIWDCYDGRTEDSPIYGKNSSEITKNGYKCYWKNIGKAICSCGYSKDMRKEHQTILYNQRWRHNTNDHVGICEVCNASSISERCVNSEGKIINCKNIGTCVKCGRSFNSLSHRQSDVNINKWNSNAEFISKCPDCGTQFFKYFNCVCSRSGNTITLKYSIECLDKFTIDECPKLASDYAVTFIDKYEINAWTIATNTLGHIVYNVTHSFILKSSYLPTRNLFTRCNNTMSYNGSKPVPLDGSEGTWCLNQVNFSNFGNYDIMPPENINITTVNSTSITLGTEHWVNQKSFTISGEDNLAEYLSLIVKDSDGKQYFSGSIITNGTSPKTFSFTFTPNIEAKEEKDFIFTISDPSNNKISVTKKISYTDSLSPTFKSGTSYITPWVKEREISVITEDKGSGNVKIGFYEEELKNTDKSGNTYTRKYKITGDIYNKETIRLYAKDGLGLISTQNIDVDKIDNTKPTITKITESKNGYGSTKLTITANDNHPTKGAGSGIKNYAIRTDDTIPEISEFNKSNVIEVNFPKKYNIWAMDNVGNISQLKSITPSVDIKYNIKCKYNQNGIIKTININDVILGMSQNLPIMKVMPIDTLNCYWSYNNEKVENTFDLDKYITTNNQTISIDYYTNGDNSINVYENDTNFSYTILCQYNQENSIKIATLSNVKIGEQTNLPIMKTLPINVINCYWVYNNIKVNNSLDIDKYVKYNNEIINIKYWTNGDDSINVYDSDVIFKYNVKCEYWCEIATKSIIINDVELGMSQNLPIMKVMPIDTLNCYWFYNNEKVENTFDLDKYITTNNQTITIDYYTNGDSSINVYENDTNFSYTILCQYNQENSIKIATLSNVKIGEQTNLPIMKTLPINVINCYWVYDNIKVNNSLDIDKFVKYNNEIIYIKYWTNGDDNINVYENDVIFKYIVKCEYWCEIATKSIIINDVEIGVKKDLPKLHTLPIDAKVKGWCLGNNVVNSTLDIDKYVKCNNETISIEYIIIEPAIYSSYDTKEIKNINYNIIYKYNDEKNTNIMRIASMSYILKEKNELLKINYKNEYIRNNGWFLEDIKINNMKEIEKMIIKNNQTLSLTIKINHLSQPKDSMMIEDNKSIIKKEIPNNDIKIETIEIKKDTKIKKKRKDLIDLLNEIYKDWKDQNNIKNTRKLDLIDLINAIYEDFDKKKTIK